MSGLFTDTMTVYNHYQDDSGRDAWRRTVVRGVQWTHGKRQVSVVNGIATESIVESVTIDFDRCYPGRLPYMEPLIYEKLPPEEAGKCWTLDQQSGMDYLVLGASDLDISKPAELRQSFQYQGAVSAVSDNRNRPRLKTIKVVVK